MFRSIAVATVAAALALAPAAAADVNAHGSVEQVYATGLTPGAPATLDVYTQSTPPDGYGYLTTRDGTKLAIDVHPPQDVSNAEGIDLPTLPSGPSPTLIEYSGYGYAAPAGPQNGIATVANLMGFTVVDVNMRGTGCSGGAFDFFEPLHGLARSSALERT